MVAVYNGAMRKMLPLFISCCLLFHFGLASASMKLQIDVTGIKDAPYKNVLARLKLREKALGKISFSSVQAFYQRAPKEINAALQPYGYFRSKIKSQLQPVNNGWLARFVIKPGPLLRVTAKNIKITGAARHDKHFQHYLRKHPLRVGDVFVSSKYEDAKQRLFTLAARRGYLRAKMIRSQVQINLHNYTCRIVWLFASGPRYYFGPVTFTKNPFSVSFLHRFLTFATGEHYSGKKLQKSTDNYNDSDLFYSVMADPDIKRARRLRVPVKFHLIPRYSQQYTFGAGYGTDTGPRGLFGVTLRNLTPTGHRLNAVIKGSPKDLNFEAHYLIPGPQPATDLFDISAISQYQKTDAGISRTIKAGGSYVTVLRHHWKQTLSLNLQQEWYTLTNQPTRSSLLLLPSATWLRTKANDPIRPTKGYRINIQLQGAARHILSNVSFIQAEIEAKVIRPLAKRLLLVLRGNVGVTAASPAKNIPLTLLFTAGGAQSVRGYGYQELGPGRDLLVGSAELRFRVYKDWYAATFFDVGNASNTFKMRYYQGAGAGIVWLSPIGAIALSCGWALNLPRVPGQRHRIPFRIQFSMGPELA